MGNRYKLWKGTDVEPASLDALRELLLSNRKHNAIERLSYGDYGIESVRQTIVDAITQGSRIALYADYDVDGTMSCVSWIWFFRAIGFTNFTHYIPCRFKEGYGLNLDAVRYLIEEQRAELIITMDTGITANAEAAYCKERGVTFICTDHHTIQPSKMPDCLILNPKLHENPDYQELCGCGITFVLLRRIAETFPIPQNVWGDLLALTGMATLCDVVPLNPVNHSLAKRGIAALVKSQRQIFQALKAAASLGSDVDEKDVGFRIGPRINAVGRLGHADAVIEAFISENPAPLVEAMSRCNTERKDIQNRILVEAEALAETHPTQPLLFLGGDWHPGVVGIAASRIAERFWKPTWLFCRTSDVCKGSARSIPGFDVTLAMRSVESLWMKFGGHRAAGGFSFKADQEREIRDGMIEYAEGLRQATPHLWESAQNYDCTLPIQLCTEGLALAMSGLKPFGHGFDEPVFRLRAPVANTQYYRDKTTGKPKHTALFVEGGTNEIVKVVFFNEVLPESVIGENTELLVTAHLDTYNHRRRLSLHGKDWTVQTA